MAWFGKDLKEHLVPVPLPWAETHPTGPGCSEQGIISFLGYEHCIWLTLVFHSQLRGKKIGCDSWTPLNVDQTVSGSCCRNTSLTPVTVMGDQITDWVVQWAHKSLEITRVNLTLSFYNLWEIRYRSDVDFQACEECQCLWAGSNDLWSAWKALEHNIWNICRRACDSIAVVVFQIHLSHFKYIFNFLVSA